MDANRLPRDWTIVIAAIFILMAVVPVTLSMINKSLSSPRPECDMPELTNVNNYCECSKLCGPLGIETFQPMDREYATNYSGIIKALCVCKKGN